jgi:alanyl-tRNA synthetase
MNAQLLYLEDPLKLEFETVVRAVRQLPGGRTGAVLEQTYFYPTGGGQEYDTGTLGEARVLEVFKEGDPPVLVHVLDRAIPLGPAVARIDPERRLRHMQHHTAQHLLSQCFVKLFERDTLSAHINGYAPSSLDLPWADLPESDLERAEALANRVIYEDRRVKSYFVTPEELAALPLRRPPSVVEDIRIVEIDGFDYSACGGTHCLATGMIGVVKILKAERQNDRLRVSFVAGQQALEYFRDYHAIVTGLAGQLSVGTPELAAMVLRQAEQLKATQKELQALRLAGAAAEARQLAEGAQPIGARRAVLVAFDGRPILELRALAEEFKGIAGLVAALSTYNDGKLSLVVACHPDAGLAARDLLQQLLKPLGGRGGGDAQIAQGGCQASVEQAHAFPETARAILSGLS